MQFANNRTDEMSDNNAVNTVDRCVTNGSQAAWYLPVGRSGRACYLMKTWNYSYKHKKTKKALALGTFCVVSIVGLN